MPGIVLHHLLGLVVSGLLCVVGAWFGGWFGRVWCCCWLFGWMVFGFWVDLGCGVGFFWVFVTVF